MHLQHGIPRGVENKKILNFLLDITITSQKMI